MLKISIPKPCHEDWSAMTPNQQGRHCSACAKTVVDFTKMSDEEVKNFLVDKKEEKLCGRFNNTQLHRIRIDLPNNILQVGMPFWKRFLAACLIIFSTTLFSCDVTTTGEPVTNTVQIMGAMKKTSCNEVLMEKAVDSSDTFTITSGTTVGALAIPVPPMDSIIIVETQLQGDIQLLPEEPVIPVLMGEPAIPDTLIRKDTVLNKCKLPDPPKADTANCNKVFY